MYDPLGNIKGFPSNKLKCSHHREHSRHTCEGIPLKKNKEYMSDKRLNFQDLHQSLENSKTERS